MGGVPAGIDVDVYDGTGDVPASADDVELWVPPYIGADPIVRRVIGSLPGCASQLLTAGVENVRRYVPDGVVLCNARGVHDASTAELAVALMLACCAASRTSSGHSRRVAGCQPSTSRLPIGPFC